jgi:hypothetical protein
MKRSGSVIFGTCSPKIRSRESSGKSIHLDQWGVELGKVLAQRIVNELESDAPVELSDDSSTNNLIRRCRDVREKVWRKIECVSASQPITAVSS